MPEVKTHAPQHAQWFDVMRRLWASPVCFIDRQLFVYLARNIANAPALDTLATATHRQLRSRFRRLGATSPIGCVLDTAAHTLHRMTPGVPLSGGPFILALSESSKQLQNAWDELPSTHAAVLTLCVCQQLPTALAAKVMGMAEPLLHRYNTQARALLRCHPSGQ